MTSKHYEIIGRTFVKRGTDVARRTTDVLMSFPAVQADFSMMSLYYERYASTLYEITTKNKRVFLAAMLKMYLPYMFVLPSDCMMKIEQGFVKTFCRVTGVNAGNVSRYIRQVIFEYKTYDDFRNSVDNAFDGLKYKIAG